jgi:hypothetical protein
MQVLLLQVLRVQQHQQQALQTAQLKPQHQPHPRQHQQPLLQVISQPLPQE